MVTQGKLLHTKEVNKYFINGNFTDLSVVMETSWEMINENSGFEVVLGIIKTIQVTKFVFVLFIYLLFV